MDTYALKKKSITITTPFSPLSANDENNNNSNMSDSGASSFAEHNSQNQMTSSSGDSSSLEESTDNALDNASSSITNANSNLQSNGSNNNSNYSNAGYLTYQNPTDGITMSYPSNWQKIEYPPGAMNYGVGHRIVASFLAPMTNSSGLSREYVSLQISNQADANKIIPQNQSGVIKSSTNLAGHKAFKLTYANKETMYLDSMSPANLHTTNLKTMQVWTTVGANTYLFTYQAEASKYSGYLPVVQKMLDSFKLSESAGTATAGGTGAGTETGNITSGVTS